MFTTAAYYQLVDPAGADVRIPPVVDQSVRISGNDLYVPALNKLMAAAGMLCSTGGTGACRLQSPSLLRSSRYVVSPTQGAAAAASLPADPHAVTFFENGGYQLQTNEGLDAIINTDPAAAQIQAVVIWLCDQYPSSVDPQDAFTIRATGTTAMVAGQWVNVPLAFDDALPVGHYSIIGMRAQSATLLAARLVVPGNAWRPGVLGCNSAQHRDDKRFRYGNIGEYAQFDSTVLFSVECLAEAGDAAETFHFDVAKIG